MTVVCGAVNDEPTVTSFDAQDWPQILAKLGDDGWEMVAALGAPTGANEFYYYFKRPIEE